MLYDYDISKSETAQVKPRVNMTEKLEKLERYRRLNAFVRPYQILFAGSSLMEQIPVHHRRDICPSAGCEALSDGILSGQSICGDGSGDAGGPHMADQ